MSRTVARIVLIILSLSGLLAVAAPAGASPVPGFPLAGFTAWLGHRLGDWWVPGNPNAGRQRRATAAPAKATAAPPEQGRHGAASSTDTGLGIDPNGGHG